ncbi:hypothetical protein [Streptomyces bauhiniae]|uniref:hypothetical protein n=1 Tax=Streptomyces bauhiniae TaxID=2340725 RepID=UPI001EF2A207|nr:hypothetical protein [Streptomyces bauhiniae]
MTSRAPMPDPSDKNAIRQWMRQIRNSHAHGDEKSPETPAELSEIQRNRLLQSVGVSPEEPGLRRLDVALTGSLTSDHTVPVSTLGAFLTNLQESVSAVAQAVFGHPTSFASIPRDIRDATRLSASATYPSSFGVAMYGPQIHADQYDLFGELPGRLHTVLDEAVNKVLDIADLSDGGRSSNDLLTEQLAPLGQRAMKHIGALTAGLSDYEMGVRVTWHIPGGSVRHSDWTPSGVQRVHLLCEESEFTEAERITVTGWLGAASSFRGKVEIRTDSGEIIRASTEPELTGRLDLYFNKRVSADLEVTKVVFAGGRERKLYSVLSIRKLQADEL